MRISWVLSVLLLFTLSGCGGDSDFEEGLGFSAEVEDLTVSDDIIGVGDFVGVGIKVDTGDFFSAQDANVLVRFSPELRYVEGSASFEIDASYDSEESPSTGTPQFGPLYPICEGLSEELGDGYIAFRVSGGYFAQAYNNTARVRLSLRAIAPAREAFVISDARDSLSSSQCENFTPEPEAATSVAIVGRTATAEF